MTARPTIYLTNPGSRGCHGPGRLLHAQAFPPPFVRRCTSGRVPALTPNPTDFLALDAGQISAEEYRRRFVDGLVLPNLRPGNLGATDGVGPGCTHWTVEDGDTVVCTCSVADARAGGCHRAWCAEPLRTAGWRVVLDGVDLDEASDAPLAFRFGDPVGRELRRIAEVPHGATENRATTLAQDVLDAADVVRLGDARASRGGVLDRSGFEREVGLMLEEGISEAADLPRLADLAAAHASHPDADPLVEALAPILRTAVDALRGVPGADDLLREQVSDFVGDPE